MNTKKCTSCSEDKPITDFRKDRNICKLCTNAARRIKYNSDDAFRANKQATTRAYVKVQRRDFQIRILKLLVVSGCVDCGEKDPIVLEFDHVRGEKVSGVAAMIRTCTNWNIIQFEIEKCEVRCANCHRKKTAKTHGWYADIDLAALAC